MQTRTSSTQTHASFSPENVLYGKRLVVVRERETLADLVRRVRKEKGLSLMAVRVASGYHLATSYISRIENGDVTNVGLEKLKALAKGLGLSEEQVIAAATGRAPENDPGFTKSRFGLLSLKFDKVPHDRRVNVEALLDLLDRELDRLAKQ